MIQEATRTEEQWRERERELENEVESLDREVRSLEEHVENERAERHDYEIDGADRAYAHACELLRDVERGVLTFDEVAVELSRGRSTRPEFYGGHR